MEHQIEHQIEQKCYRCRSTPLRQYDIYCSSMTSLCIELMTIETPSSLAFSTAINTEHDSPGTEWRGWLPTASQGDIRAKKTTCGH